MLNNEVPNNQHPTILIGILTILSSIIIQVRMPKKS
jgi:hypothetical protein